MVRVGVCLSGCGVQDGTEIHEAVITLLALERANAKVICIAPDSEQRRVSNHLSGKDSKESRNVLVESARIARGNVQSIKKIKDTDLDALIFPGGFGAALNLCDFGVSGSNCTVHKEVQRLVEEMHKSGKPIGAMCIAPVILARVLGNKHIRLTIGDDSGTASKLEAMGAKHVNCPVDDIVVDENYKIVTTPAYMLANCIVEAAAGIDKLVNKVLQLAASTK